MEYITVKEAGEKWRVSSRAFTYHIIDGRIPGAVKKETLWLIPASAVQPEDRRKRKENPHPQREDN